MIHRPFLLTSLRKLRLAVAFFLPFVALGLAGPAGAQVVISQVFTGGGSGGATYVHDFVELHNKGGSAVTLLNNYSLLKANGAGTAWDQIKLTGSIPAGGFYLIALSPGAALVTANDDMTVTGTSLSATNGVKLALYSNQTQLLAGVACPTSTTSVTTYASGTPQTPGTTATPGLEDFVGIGVSNCYEGAPKPDFAVTASIVRGNSVNNSCSDSGNNSTDFTVLSFPVPRNSKSAAQQCVPYCGPGIALTTGANALWQQLSLACVPTTGNNTVTSLFGGTTTGKLDPDKYGTTWSISRRNATNTGNETMLPNETITVGTGHWIKSFDPPNGLGPLVINSTQATPTPLTTVTNCSSAAANPSGSCYVLRVPSAAAGYRMMANPLPFDIDWRLVRVRVNNGTPSTPTVAYNNGNGQLSNQIWIYGGAGYKTWSDADLTKGNLQSSKSFFVKVLPAGLNQTIELLLPAVVSTLATTTGTTYPKTGVPVGTEAFVAEMKTGNDTISRASRSTWVVDLDVQNVDTGWEASAKLGQWNGADAGRDANDLAAMAPFSQPYLTLVFPHLDWRAEPGDYNADLRAATGFADKWDFEVRAQPLGSKVVLRWNVPAAVLAKSRLIDRDTGLVVYPSDPNYANGYPMTLDTPVRRLTWEYLGN